MKITTNNRPRPLAALYELPSKHWKDFDYIGDYDRSDRFVKFKGQWYDALDTQTITTTQDNYMGWSVVVKPDDPLAKWHAFISDSFFSGILFRFVDDDQVVVGAYST